jgi:hypothetical protein
LLRALDLHVLSLPPAFALSQDQTLKLDEIQSRLITTFDEVPPNFRARKSATTSRPAAEDAAFAKFLVLT